MFKWGYETEKGLTIHLKIQDKWKTTEEAFFHLLK